MSEGVLTSFAPITKTADVTAMTIIDSPMAFDEGTGVAVTLQSDNAAGTAVERRAAAAVDRRAALRAGRRAGGGHARNFRAVACLSRGRASPRMRRRPSFAA